MKSGELGQCKSIAVGLQKRVERSGRVQASDIQGHRKQRRAKSRRQDRDQIADDSVRAG